MEKLPKPDNSGSIIFVFYKFLYNKKFSLTAQLHSQIKMNEKHKDPKWIWFPGCGGLIVAITISLLIITLVASKQGYQITHYPGAVFVSRDIDYSGLPYAICQTEVYVTSDAGWHVYSWYAPYCETASCVYKEGDDYSLTIEKSQFYGHSKLSIALQEIPFGRKIYVSRFLILPKWP